MAHTLRKADVYKIDRAKMSAVVTETNPIRRYVRGEAFEGDESGHSPIKVQPDRNGQNYFFTDGGDELNAADIPEYIHEHLRKAPIMAMGQTVEQVLRYCPICPEPDNCVASGVYEAHLIAHLEASGIAKRVVKADIQDPAPTKLKRKRKPAKAKARKRGGSKKRPPLAVAV